MAEDLFELIRTQGVERIGRYYSKYRAIVLDSKPNDNDIGSIMVHIPRVQGGMKIVARSKAMVGNPGYGVKYFTPRPGEIVWIEFENGNPAKPLWSYHTWGKDECPNDLNDINTCGIVTPHGHKLLIKESDQGDSISISMDNGSSVEFTKDLINYNGGKNFGIVNVESLRSFIEATVQDLVISGSGTNVAKWMEKGMVEIEDKKIIH